jgi:hypothetical protein
MSGQKQRPRYVLGNDGSGKIMRMDTLTGKAWLFVTQEPRDGSVEARWFPILEPVDEEDKPEYARPTA